MFKASNTLLNSTRVTNTRRNMHQQAIVFALVAGVLFTNALSDDSNAVVPLSSELNSTRIENRSADVCLVGCGSICKVGCDLLCLLVKLVPVNGVDVICEVGCAQVGCDAACRAIC